jgi:hypothetical protein
MSAHAPAVSLSHIDRVVLAASHFDAASRIPINGKPGYTSQRGPDMAQVRYSTDAILLDADTDNWKEKLHLTRQRREQRGWKLIAIFPHSAERVKDLGPLLNRPTMVVILLFRRSQREEANTSLRCLQRPLSV